MSKTELSGKQVKDGSVQRVDLDVSTSGQAVTTKIVAGDNISLSSTGVDAGTGDVTVSLGGTIASDITSLQSADTTLQANIDAEESARIAGDASTLASAQSYADTAVAGIVNSAPETLDTLNELAAALGDDPNFATTISAQIGLKADSSSLATVATSGDYNDLINTPSAGASDLDGLSDVTLTSSTNGDYLKYDGSSWVNSSFNSIEMPTTNPFYIKGNVNHTWNNNLLRITNSDQTLTHLVMTGAGRTFMGSSTGAINIGGYASAHTLTVTSRGNADGALCLRHDSTSSPQPFLECQQNNTLFLRHIPSGLLIQNNFGNSFGIRVQNKNSSIGNADLLQLMDDTNTVFSVNASGNMTSSGRVDAKQYTETSVNAFDTALSPSSGTLTVDVSSAGAVFGALDASVTTWAFTNVPTDNSKVTTVTVVLDGNASYTYGDACSVNGTAITDGVMWQDGSAPASTDGMDMVTFVIAKDSAGTVKVFGYGTTNFS